MSEESFKAMKLQKQIRAWVIFFIIGIAISGITAFPLETELRWLSPYTSYMPDFLANWINSIKEGIIYTNAQYPFIAYGTDWLAFAHIIIAMLFVGLLKDPVRNRWIADWGIICCVLVFPLAFIAGPIRHIPLFHQLIDCSFGAIGIIPLLFVKRKIKLLGQMKQ